MNLCSLYVPNIQEGYISISFLLKGDNLKWNIDKCVCVSFKIIFLHNACAKIPSVHGQENVLYIGQEEVATQIKNRIKLQWIAGPMSTGFDGLKISFIL